MRKNDLFIANNGKKYLHRKRHKANQRQVDFDIYNKSFEERHGKCISRIEFEVFNVGYNLGYKEGKARTLKLKREKE